MANSGNTHRTGNPSGRQPRHEAPRRKLLQTV